MLGHAKIRPEFNFCSVMTKRPIYVGKCHVHKLSLLRHCVTDEIEIRQQWRRADRFANLLTRSVVKNIDGGTIPSKKKKKKKEKRRKKVKQPLKFLHCVDSIVRLFVFSLSRFRVPPPFVSS
jgi:hypothetical protein